MCVCVRVHTQVSVCVCVCVHTHVRPLLPVVALTLITKLADGQPTHSLSLSLSLAHTRRVSFLECNLFLDIFTGCRLSSVQEVRLPPGALWVTGLTPRSAVRLQSTKAELVVPALLCQEGARRRDRTAVGKKYLTFLT